MEKQSALIANVNPKGGFTDSGEMVSIDTLGVLADIDRLCLG